MALQSQPAWTVAAMAEKVLLYTVEQELYASRASVQGVALVGIGPWVIVGAVVDWGHALRVVDGVYDLLDEFFEGVCDVVEIDFVVFGRGFRILAHGESAGDAYCFALGIGFVHSWLRLSYPPLLVWALFTVPVLCIISG